MLDSNFYTVKRVYQNLAVKMPTLYSQSVSRLFSAIFISALLSACGGGGGGGDNPVFGGPSLDENTADEVTGDESELGEPVNLQASNLSSSTISLKGAGGVETTTVTFTLVDSFGQGMAGEQVELSLSNYAGDAKIAGSGDVYPVLGITDDSGEVSVLVQSGVIPTTTKVIAIHTSSGVRGESGGINISTGIPVQDALSLSASTWNPSRARNFDGVEVILSIIASDEFGHNVPDGTAIHFWSPEGGNIENSCFISNGECEVSWQSADPRQDDGRYSMLVYTNGAEVFSDQNGNNIFDAGDLFTASDDLGEPFVDNNENGERDPGEQFVDTNDSANFEPDGNGEWDGPCLQEANADAICSGGESVVIYRQFLIITPTDSARLLSSSHLPGELVDLSATNQTVSVTIADSNTQADTFGGNPMGSGTTVSFRTTNGTITSQGPGNVPVTTVPTTHSVTLTGDGTSSSGTLTLIVTSNGVEKAFNWPVSD